MLAVDSIMVPVSEHYRRILDGENILTPTVGYVVIGIDFRGIAVLVAFFFSESIIGKGIDGPQYE